MTYEGLSFHLPLILHRAFDAFKVSLKVELLQVTARQVRVDVVGWRGMHRSRGARFPNTSLYLVVDVFCQAIVGTRYVFAGAYGKRRRLFDLYFLDSVRSKFPRRFSGGELFSIQDQVVPRPFLPLLVT